MKFCSEMTSSFIALFPFVLSYFSEISVNFPPDRMDLCFVNVRFRLVTKTSSQFDMKSLIWYSYVQRVAWCDWLKILIMHGLWLKQSRFFGAYDDLVLYNVKEVVRMGCTFDPLSKELAMPDVVIEPQPQLNQCNTCPLPR